MVHAIRFDNWLNNGQGNGDTETGAYTLGPLNALGVPTNGDGITRNAGATIFLPSENEWYKAAYYNPAANSYFHYGTSSNAVPNAAGPTATPNSANYNNAVGDLTDVGAYSKTTSPYGAFDMAGDVLQWNETFTSNSSRGLRGGSFNNPPGILSSSFRTDNFATNGLYDIGFRVASVPEPSALILATLGGLAPLACRRKPLEIRLPNASYQWFV